MTSPYKIKIHNLQHLTLLIPANKESESLPIFLSELKEYNCKKLVVLQKEDVETQRFEVIFNRSDLKFLDSKNIYVRRKEPISNPEVFLSEFLLGEKLF